MIGSGPVNTWNRMPYWTMNGVDDGKCHQLSAVACDKWADFESLRFPGFDSWPNITKPAKGASAVKDFDHIRRNFIFTDYGGSRALDHDDGSQFFR